MARPSNPRFPHTCIITRPKEVGPMQDEEEVEIIYEGVCRAYEKNTTSDRGDVITSSRGLSLPLTREDWNERGLIPQEGDSVVVNRGSYDEYGRVIDKNPGNFGGTHLVWRYGRE